MSDALYPPTPGVDAPPGYQLAPVASAVPPLTQTALITPSQTKSLSTFLNVGRVIDYEDFISLASAGSLAWDHRTPPPAGTLLEKHANIGAVMLGDMEAPLVRMRNVTLIGSHSQRGMAIAVPIPSALLISNSTGQALSLGSGVSLLHPGHVVVTSTSRLKVDGVSTLVLKPASLPIPPVPFPLLASTLLLKTIQWTRGGSSNMITGIRWKLVWADARTQESFLDDEDFLEGFKGALDSLPRSD